MTSGVAIYQSHRECKGMETQRLRQWERYIQIQDQFEIQQEYLRELSENPDFLEHVAREYLRIVGENEMPFHFE
jgi:hypothetical protein